MTTQRSGDGLRPDLTGTVLGWEAIQRPRVRGAALASLAEGDNSGCIGSGRAWTGGDVGRRGSEVGM